MRTPPAKGCMQRIGVDEASATTPAAENELLADKDAAAPWWRRLMKPKKGKHTPGVWVLYFSLAALPLFGIGQHWIPRRRSRPTTLRVLAAVGVRRVGPGAVGDDQLSRPAALPAATSRRDARADGGDVGRRSARC